MRAPSVIIVLRLPLSSLFCTFEKARPILGDISAINLCTIRCMGVSKVACETCMFLSDLNYSHLFLPITCFILHCYVFVFKPLYYNSSLSV